MQKTRLDKSNGAFREPSEVISRYLEAIYYMWSEGEPLRSARLADWLGVSRPTVTIGLRRMARDGMVRLTRSKEIELTAIEARKTPDAAGKPAGLDKHTSKKPLRSIG